MRSNIHAIATPIPDIHLQAWGTLLKAQSRLIADVEDAFADAGLPPIAWYDVLWPLHQARAPLRMGELSSSVYTIGRTGLTRLVDRLEAAGLLRRAPAPSDRRGVEVSITPEGTRLLRRMWPVYARVLHERFASVLDPDEARALQDMLERVASGQAATASLG